jgi:hypothetical protein
MHRAGLWPGQVGRIRQAMYLGREWVEHLPRPTQAAYDLPLAASNEGQISTFKVLTDTLSQWTFRDYAHNS